MSGSKTSKVMAGLPSAYSIMVPPISCDRAGEYVKVQIPADAWAKVESAFAHYGRALDRLNGSRTSKSKDPEKASWHERQKRTANALEAALNSLKLARSHGDFLYEASENWALAFLGQSAGSDVNAARLLDDAHQKVLKALVIIERAEPRKIDVPTLASARAILIKAIRDALVESGIEAKASTGRFISDLDRRPTLDDLTPFERLLAKLDIGDDLAYASFATTVRSALSG
jgi:hypothetical protein